jgi:hypothetical protein
MNEAPKPTIGAEMPYRRSQLNKRTGSLIFDQHLEESQPSDAQTGRWSASTAADRGQFT